VGDGDSASVSPSEAAAGWFSAARPAQEADFPLVSLVSGADFRSMSVADFAPILIQLVLAVTLASVILFASHLLGQRAARNRIKDTPYECGVPSEGQSRTRFSVKFYVTAMLFILFDIEVVFLIPWALVYRDFIAQNLPIVLPGLFFLGVLIVGLVYEVRKGALDWEK